MERSKPSPSLRRSANGSVNGTLDQLEQLSRTGTSYASKGLDYDELKDPRTAQIMYADALTYFSKCLSIVVPPEQEAKAKVIQEKVAANAAVIQRRLLELPPAPVVQHAATYPAPLPAEPPSLFDRVTRLLIKPPSGTTAAAQDWVELPPSAGAAAPPVFPKVRIKRKKERKAFCS